MAVVDRQDRDEGSSQRIWTQMMRWGGGRRGEFLARLLSDPRTRHAGCRRVLNFSSLRFARVVWRERLSDGVVKAERFCLHFVGRRRNPRVRTEPNAHLRPHSIGVWLLPTMNRATHSVDVRKLNGDFQLSARRCHSRSRDLTSPLSCSRSEVLSQLSVMTVERDKIIVKRQKKCVIC